MKIVQFRAVDRAEGRRPMEATIGEERSVQKNEAYMKWRDDWLNEITKTRVIDQDSRRLIASDRVFTYEKHFDP